MPQIEDEQILQVRESCIEVPCNLSEEALRMGSAETVATIEANAANAARADERQRLAGLSAAFGSDPAFVSECVSSGISVTEAKATRFDAVCNQLAEASAENARLVSENTTLKTRLDATKLGFVATDDAGESAPDNSVEGQIEATWTANGGNCHQKFNGSKDAFKALMVNSPAKLAAYKSK